MILCECGEIIDGYTFKDYIKTSANPSTPTIGHQKCGCIFNFIVAEKNKMNNEAIECLLIEVDRLKSSGKLSDVDILITAFRNVMTKRSLY